MKKKFLSILLALALCLSLLPATAWATAPEGTALTDTDGTLTEGSYYLNGNVTLANNLTIDGDVTLDLNGYVLKGTGTGSVITVSAGAALTITDSRPTEPHYFTYDADGAWTWHEAGETIAPGDDSVMSLDSIATADPKKTFVAVTGGVITGGVKEGGNGGGGVCVNGGTLNMNGGNIVGNRAAIENQSGGNGGGVYIINGTFKMSGDSTISGNTNQGNNTGGAGVFFDGTTFTMSDNSRITDNTNDNRSGGGVYINNGAFKMSGYSTISNNKGNQGAGVYFRGTTFTMSDNSQITGNIGTNNGGGVNVNSGSFEVSGNIKITNNKGKNGGGVFVANGKNFTMTGGEISGNTATTGNGGGICNAGGTVNLTYVTISNNRATTGNGGGIYTGGTGGDSFGPSGFVGFTSSKIIGCSATDGGAVYVADKGRFESNRGVIGDTGADGNTATNGGGVYVKHGGTATFAGGLKLSDNTATGNGGGIYSAGAVGLEDATISGNTATTGNGGGIYLFGGDENAAGSIFLGKTAAITGNKKGETNNNLYLCVPVWQVRFGTGKDVPVPEEGMSIGVTTGAELSAGSSVAITSNGSMKDLTYFVPDSDEYYVNCKPQAGEVSEHLELVKMPEDSHQVTITPAANGTVYADKLYAVNNSDVTLTVAPDDGYQLKSLTVTDAGSTPVDVTDNKFTMPAANVTVTAVFEEIPTPPAPTPPSGGGSSTPTVTVPVSGDKDSVKVQASVSGSNATVKNVTSEQLETVGTGENVTIDLSSLSKSVSGVTIPKTTLENVAASDADGLEVKLPNGTTAVFDSTTVAAVAEQAAGSNIQLVVDKENKAEQALTAAQKETVKALNDALVLDAYFVSNGKRISDFKGGEAELTVSYPTTKPVRVWYVAEDGTKELVPSTFDGKAAKFVVTHFSHYAIEILDGSSYAACPQDNTCVYAKFTDANTAAWYHDGVHYCVENGMMNGVSNTQFAPNGTLTRGMVVTVLARLDGVTITSTGSEWYADGQAWAVKNGISDGTNMTGNITREQLATMLYRYAQFKGVDTNKFTENTNTLSHNDVFTISDWATSGMHFCIAAGVVNGDNYGNLNPHNTATRAEAAAMFQRFSEKVIK